MVVWNVFYFSRYWEYHHPNGRPHIFQRVVIPPTSWWFFGTTHPGSSFADDDFDDHLCHFMIFVIFLGYQDNHVIMNQLFHDHHAHFPWKRWTNTTFSRFFSLHFSGLSSISVHFFLGISFKNATFSGFFMNQLQLRQNGVGAQRHRSCPGLPWKVARLAAALEARCSGSHGSYPLKVIHRKTIGKPWENGCFMGFNGVWSSGNVRILT